MKKQVTYILLVLYVIVQIRPLAVIVEDLLAHTFYEAQHMATIHYENGKYHIHADLKEIAEEDQGSGSEKVPYSEKVNDSPQNINSETNYFFQPNYSFIILDQSHNSKLLSGYYAIKTPPPDLI